MIQMKCNINVWQKVAELSFNREDRVLRLGGLVAAATYSHPQHTYNSVWQVTPLKERQQNSSNGENG